MKPQDVLSARLQMLIEIALHADCDCEDTLAEQDERAREIGIVGVEIDAARSRKSFDIHALAAIRLSCAIQMGSAQEVQEAEAQAYNVGLTRADIQAIKAFIETVK